MSSKNVESLRKEIIEAGKMAYNRGFVASNDGNISVRIDKKRILITPTGVSKGFMKPGDLIIVDTEGNLIEGKKKPSSESDMHLKIYADRPDVNSVCHTHPPYATAFAVAGIPLDKMILPEVIIRLGTIPIVEYGTTGTHELYGMISRYIKDFDALLLANHGAVTLGKSVREAYYLMETVEHAAKIIYLASILGKAKSLSKGQVKKLISIRDKLGIRKDIGKR